MPMWFGAVPRKLARWSLWCQRCAFRCSCGKKENPQSSQVMNFWKNISHFHIRSRAVADHSYKGLVHTKLAPPAAAFRCCPCQPLSIPAWGFCWSRSCTAALPAPMQTSQGQGAASAWARGREEPAGSWGSLDQAPVWLGKAGRSARLRFTAFCPDFIWRIPTETQHFAWSKSKQCSVSPFFKASLHLQTSLIPLASQQDAFLFKEQREVGVQEEPSQQELHAAQRLGRRPPASLQCHEISSKQISGSFNIDESDTSKPVSFLFIFFKQEHRMLWTISLLSCFGQSESLQINVTGCPMIPSLFSK